MTWRGGELTMWNGTCPTFSVNPGFIIMLKKNIVYFIANVEGTSSASMTDVAYKLWIPVLELTGCFDIKIRYPEVDFALSGVLPQFASETAVSLNPPLLHVMNLDSQLF